MKTLEQMKNELDSEMNRVYTEYTKLHEALDPHRGKQLDETNVPEVNRILKEIQEKFAELYPVYYWIAHRHQFVTNATDVYNNFIELLKKNGAKKDGDTPPEEQKPEAQS